jgi:hypothetical protein
MFTDKRRLAACQNDDKPKGEERETGVVISDVVSR